MPENVRTNNFDGQIAVQKIGTRSKIEYEAMQFKGNINNTVSTNLTCFRSHQQTDLKIDNEAMAVDQDQYDEVYEPLAIASRNYKSNLAQETMILDGERLQG